MAKHEAMPGAYDLMAFGVDPCSPPLSVMPGAGELSGDASSATLETATSQEASQPQPPIEGAK